MVTKRAEPRRLRRTQKSKRARLRMLLKRFSALGLEDKPKSELITFCRRRGGKPLFSETETESLDDGDEILFRHYREDFFIALNKKIKSLIPPEI